MPILLMNLRHVPEDEADEVRALLGEHGIDYYETPPSRWAISMGGIWLSRPEQADTARRLLADYQEQRRRRAREAREAARREGTAETFAGLVRREPLRVLVILALAGLVLYLTLMPFLGMGG